jgi:hypothetical protein
VVSSPKVIEIELLAGSLNALFWFPQYLMKAMLGWAIALAERLVMRRIDDTRPFQLLAQALGKRADGGAVATAGSFVASDGFIKARA